MISAIICSINPRKFDAVSDNLTDRLGDGPLEIIGIHDARSLAEGYNRGIDQSKGDILVFCHDDVEIIAPGGSQLLRQHLQTHDLVGCAGTSRLIDSNWICAGDPFVHGIVAYPAEDAWPAGRFDVAVWGKLHRTIVEDIQALDGFFFAANRPVLDVIRFDERNFDGFHVYDTDFTFAAHLAGFRTAVCKDILIAHQSGGNFDEVYRDFSARFMNKYRAQLAAQAHGTRKIALARNLDRAQLRQLYGTVVGTPR
jgi:GT2 family glycosyltransferase